MKYYFTCLIVIAANISIVQKFDSRDKASDSSPSLAKILSRLELKSDQVQENGGFDYWAYIGGGSFSCSAYELYNEPINGNYGFIFSLLPSMKDGEKVIKEEYKLTKAQYIETSNNLNNVLSLELDSNSARRPYDMGMLYIEHLNVRSCRIMYIEHKPNLEELTLVSEHLYELLQEIRKKSKRHP